MCKRFKHSCANESHLFISFLFKAFSIGGNERLQTHFHVLSLSNKKPNQNKTTDLSSVSKLVLRKQDSFQLANCFRANFNCTTDVKVALPHTRILTHVKNTLILTVLPWLNGPLVTGWSLYVAQYLEGDQYQWKHSSQSIYQLLGSRGSRLLCYCSVVAPVFGTSSAAYCSIMRSVQSRPYIAFTYKHHSTHISLSTKKPQHPPQHRPEDYGHMGPCLSGTA